MVVEVSEENKILNFLYLITKMEIQYSTGGTNAGIVLLNKLLREYPHLIWVERNRDFIDLASDAVIVVYIRCKLMKLPVVQNITSWERSLKHAKMKVVRSTHGGQPNKYWYVPGITMEHVKRISVPPPELVTTFDHHIHNVEYTGLPVIFDTHDTSDIVAVLAAGTYYEKSCNYQHYHGVGVASERQKLDSISVSTVDDAIPMDLSDDRADFLSNFI
jgi:hypothetical protein